VSILQELWRGNLAPQEPRETSERRYKELTKLIIRAEDNLREGMSEEQQEQFEKNYDLLLERQSIIEEETFVEAAQLGARLVIGLIGGEV